jgi:dipeptidyl aminopeptidase/acylaminoacyl peptidase
MKYIAPVLITAAILGVIYLGLPKNTTKNIQTTIFPSPVTTPLNSPMNISFMRSQGYPGSDVKIEETLSPGSNYNRYIASFIADGLKEYALLTVPKSGKPAKGFPVIVFNHGYITPELYTPDGNYIAYVDALAKAGYIVIKPNYRGNGKSEGSPGSTYFSPNYPIDDLNAVVSIKKYPDANPDKIGLWGHSMGGNITLRTSEVSKDIKAAVIWGGVVGSYSDILYNWQNRVVYKPNAEDLSLRNLGSQSLLAAYGTPSQNPDFWNSIDPTFNLNFISAPFQIHVGLADPQVPPDFSKTLYEKLKASGKVTEYYEYPGANHDINQGFALAMQRTVTFFDKYLK